MTRRRVSILLGAVLAWLAPSLAVAQVGNCDILPGTDEVTASEFLTFVRRPRLACPEGVRISADSLRHHPGANLFELWGRVSFQNAEISLQSRDAQYYESDARLTAQGNARLQRKADGSTVTGESLELLEQNAQRPQEQLTATGGRPHALLHPERREAAPADTFPFEVDADRIVLRGKEMEASGDVEISRGTLDGSADEVQYRGDPGQLVLRGSASLLTDDRDLVGGLLVLQMPNGELSEVTAREGGSLVSEQLTFEAPYINFTLIDGALETLVGGRDVAWNPPDSVTVKRPMAVSKEFTITGDSIDVTAPSGALERVVATGSAHAESLASQLVVPEGTPDVARRDWIEGDTIVALFSRIESDSSATARSSTPDTTAASEPDVRLEQLRARVGARAFYRMAADTAGALGESETDCLAFHYVIGDSISIVLENGAVVSTEILGHVKGQHWEPPAGCNASGEPADSMAAPPPAASPATPSPTSPTPPPPPPPPSDPSPPPLGAFNPMRPASDGARATSRRRGRTRTLFVTRSRASVHVSRVWGGVA